MIAAIAAWAVALPPCLALTIYSVEILSGLKPLPPTQGEAPASVAVLIPAHNEALGIGETVMRLREELSGLGRIIVVADNCEDATADRAREAGAEVVERTDLAHRGKGYALAFGRAHLSSDPPQVVVVIDADCAFVPGGLKPLAAAAHQGLAAQAVNLLDPDRTATPLVQISNFALLVKNLIRGRATSRLGGAALLTGTGMAFDWKIFAEAPLASGNIVEDLGLGLTLVEDGIRPRLIEQAQVRSAPARLEDSRGQRQRWEHGFLATALRQAPGLLARGLVLRSRAQFAIGLHLLVPPLALLFLVSLLAMLVTAVLGLADAGWSATLTLLTGLVAASCVTCAAWGLEGRGWLTLGALLRAPVYVLWKIPLYARFIVARETRWIRTRRVKD